MWLTFAETLVKVRDVLVNMELWLRQSSPNFARLRQSSHEGARMLLVHPGTCLMKRCKWETDFFTTTGADAPGEQHR